MTVRGVERLLGRRVNPDRQEVVKFMPANPPARGRWPDGIVLVDGVRCRVTRCRVKWDGPRWKIISLRVKECPK